SSRRRHTRFSRDWSSDVCSSDLVVSADDLAPDVLLLTHAHGDHWGDAPDILKRTGALLIANYEITTYAQQRHGHENAHPMNTGEIGRASCRERVESAAVGGRIKK